MKIPEILSPAGNLEKLEIAYEYGADAAYVSGRDFSLRSYAGNFSDEELAKAAQLAQVKKKKIYAAVNIFARNSDLEPISRHIAFLYDAGFDAIIVSDLGIMAIAKKSAPKMPVHVSVQANNMNYMEALEWQKLGAKRVILARELSIDEIREIREITPGLELEAFVHGSVCMSLSGRCLLSNYLTGRDANAGECAQPCRWSYALVEEKRKGEYIGIAEDGRGTYIFNSKDICTIDRIPELIGAGIDSFKIEGRMKGPHYTAVTALAYRRERDLYMASPKTYRFDGFSMTELEKISHRQYFRGFYFEGGANAQHYPSSSYIAGYRFLGYASEAAGKTIALYVKGSFRTGEKVEVLNPDGVVFEACIAAIKDSEGIEQVYAAQDKRYSIFLESEKEAVKYSILRQKQV
ncbi:MAG TPA: U32 family peptidase [Candidatus Goldiibacteriota bacterium]|nr:U32 family peptidase [Candidatus Goldiibacteriota bacterium]